MSVSWLAVRRIRFVPEDPLISPATARAPRRPLPATALYGLIFARMGGCAQPLPPFFMRRRIRPLWSGLEVRGRLGGVAENFLDETHTITVHPGMFAGNRLGFPAR